MSSAELVALLRSDVAAWNLWRARNQRERPDLRGAELTRANLRRADLNRVDLSGASLAGADLEMADLRGAALRAADLTAARLNGADLSAAHLEEAMLYETDLSGTRIVRTHLEGAVLAGCRVYGVSAWALHLDGTEQKDLIITGRGRRGQAVITVDDLEVAQFVHLLLRSDGVRAMLAAATTKLVLLLGRFNPPQRMAILDAMRARLKLLGYVPVLFEFDELLTRNKTEAVSTLAHLSRFVIVDLTAPRSVPQELERIVPQLPSVPVQPVLQESEDEYGMFDDFCDYPTVLKTFRYATSGDLCDALESKIVAPAEELARAIERRRRLALEAEPRARGAQARRMARSRPHRPR